MEKETRQCENCRKNFKIFAEDFVFYEKIGVPAPTFCPICSMQRRMTWRNERSLYKRKDAYGKDIISVFAPEKSRVVYDQKMWWSDSWNPLDYGADYDFSRPFFDQFRDLMSRVPAVALFNKNAVGSDYCNHSEDSKNCYLAHASIWNENILYAKGAIKCKDSVDLFFADKCERCFQLINCEGSYDISYSAHATSCNNSAFLYDCHGCSNCFGCINLRNKSYYIFNEPYTKDEYGKKIKEFNLGSEYSLQEIRSRMRDVTLPYPRRYAHIVNSPGSTGDGLYDCKNCTWCFDVTKNVENCKFISNAGYSLKDSYHCYGCGMGELYYEVVDTGIGGSRVFATVAERAGTDVRYAFNCHNANFIFGGVGVRNKDYCILNKQYNKESFHALRAKIITQMKEMPYVDKKGRRYGYGEFFPAEISPYAYNETIAQEYFPLSKEDAESQGYSWREEDLRNYKITIQAGTLPDDIRNVSDTILADTIGCAHQGNCREQCTSAFRVIPQELEFYRKGNFSLPRLCPNCRHYQRLGERAGIELFHRSCMCAGAGSEDGRYKNQISHPHGMSHCPNEFETPHKKDRKDTIYCDICYQAEVI